MFVDSTGIKGRINDDLSVTHFGKDGIVESIETFIEEVEEESKSTDEVLAMLLVDLPGECSVREVRRIQGE